ncbi:MAG: tol-pal system protein YbgF, partial [Lentilitoribacter sp.]
DESQVSDAYFWLGEAYYSQGAFKDAARTFLDAHKAYPDANKAPDTLLKLGMSLVALDNRETACATYTEVGVRYPAASKAIKDKVASEQSRAQC